MSVAVTRRVRACSGTKVAQDGQPPHITRSTSSTPSVLSSGSIGVRSPDVSSASTRCIKASCVCRRRMKPTVWSAYHVQAGVSGSTAARAAIRPRAGHAVERLQ